MSDTGENSTQEHEPQGATTGSAQQTQGPRAQGPRAQVPTQVLPDDVLESLRSLISGKAEGDDYKAAQLLYNDNKQLRDKVRRLEEQVGHLEESRPAEGSRVLSKEQAAQLEEIGLISEEGEVQFKPLRQKLETAQAAERELKDLQHREGLRAVAEAEGASFDALAGLAGDERFEVKERTTEGGETVEYGAVTYEDDEGDEQTVALRDYDRLKPFHASLYQAGERITGDSRAQEQASEDAQPQRRKFPRQVAAGQKPTKSDPVSEFLERTNAQRRGDPSQR